MATRKKRRKAAKKKPRRAKSSGVLSDLQRGVRVSLKRIQNAPDAIGEAVYKMRKRLDWFYPKNNTSTSNTRVALKKIRKRRK